MHPFKLSRGGRTLSTASAMCDVWACWQADEQELSALLPNPDHPEGATFKLHGRTMQLQPVHFEWPGWAATTEQEQVALLLERMPARVLEAWGSHIILEIMQQGLYRRTRLLTLTYYDMQRFMLPPGVKADLLDHWGVARKLYLWSRDLGADQRARKAAYYAAKQRMRLAAMAETAELCSSWTSHQVQGFCTTLIEHFDEVCASGDAEF